MMTQKPIRCKISETWATCGPCRSWGGIVVNKSKLHQALIAAFPAKASLAMLMGQRFDVLYTAYTPDDTLKVEYWNIIVQINAEGWLGDFARAAHEAVPRNPELARLMLDTGLTSASPALASGEPAAVMVPTPQRTLERVVRDGNTFVDVPDFLGRLSTLEGQTCRIELAGSPPRTLGTGFLVGADLVMTNQHVIDTLTGNPPLVCRFDYLVASDGVQVRAGTTVPVAQDWLVNSRPPDPADTSLDDVGDPAPDNLDFALIRLATRVGDNPRGGTEGPENPPRGWIGIDPALAAGPNDDLFILQHPEGAPLKLGVGRLTELRGGGLRLRHDVITEGGSSGSPVLNSRLDLVGLHHAGDPNYFRLALFNQAIPMSRIVGWLDGKVDPFWTTAPP